VKRPNWETASFGIASVEIEEKDLAWLCRCGRSKPYAGSKAYPICPHCGCRMRLLDHAKLGYRR
jgi:Zn finger protein HypA/HybF involved in hydrogenase expression